MQRHLDVKVFLENFGLKVVEYPDETPTVETAAAAVWLQPGRNRQIGTVAGWREAIGCCRGRRPQGQ